MQPCWVSDISLYADTTYASLTQVMRAIVELAAPSPEQEHGRGCHQHPGAGQVPEQEYGGGGTSCCTKPHVGSSGGGCISLLPPRGEGCASKMHRHSYSTFPQLPVRLQCLKRAWIFLFTQHQRTSQKAIVLVLFSFPCTYQKSNSVMWLMGLYWPTSAVAINIWRNSQMLHAQW